MKGFNKSFHISKYKISAKTSSKYSGNIMQLHGLKGVLREGAELFPSQDPESFPMRAKRNNQKPNQTLMTQTPKHSRRQ